MQSLTNTNTQNSLAEIFDFSQAGLDDIREPIYRNYSFCGIRDERKFEIPRHKLTHRQSIQREEYILAWVMSGLPMDYLTCFGYVGTIANYKSKLNDAIIEFDGEISRRRKITEEIPAKKLIVEEEIPVKKLSFLDDFMAKSMEKERIITERREIDLRGDTVIESDYSCNDHSGIYRNVINVINNCKNDELGIKTLIEIRKQEREYQNHFYGDIGGCNSHDGEYCEICREKYDMCAKRCGKGEIGTRYFDTLERNKDEFTYNSILSFYHSRFNEVKKDIIDLVNKNAKRITEWAYHVRTDDCLFYGTYWRVTKPRVNDTIRITRYV